MTDDTTPALKLATYENQWYFDFMNHRFYFKRDPEWAVELNDFDRTFTLWSHPEEKRPSERIMMRYEAQVEGRTFYPDRIAGVITVEGRRYINVPETRRERLEREQAEAA